MNTRTDALNDAHERFADYRYLDGQGFAFHGPMGAETLSTLGLDDLVAPWVETYKERNRPVDAPAPTGRIDADDATSWRPALGDGGRVTDWEALFADQLRDRPWPEVVRRWAPRLLPGYAGGLTHGLIRTAHGVRALSADGPPSPLLLGELARGLAYWAATFTELPGRPRLAGSLTLDEALARLPRPAEPWTPIEAGTFTRIGEVADFPAAVEALGSPASVDEALSDLTAASCRILLANPEVFPIGLIHALTPTAAARVLLPHLPGVTVELLYAQLWHVNAAIVTGFTPPPAPSPSGSPAVANGNGNGAGAGPAGDGTPGDVPAPEDVLARAAEHRDTHALKFAEACVREHAVRPDPAYLLAAQHVVEVVPRW